LAKAPCPTEVVNDLHRDLYNLVMVINHSQLGPRFYRKLRRVWFCESLFNDSRGYMMETAEQEVKVPDIERATAFFIVSWMGINGVVGTKSRSSSMAKRYSGKGGDPACRWKRAVNSIPQWRERMSRVQVWNMDALAMIKRIKDERSATIYCDPPYLKEGSAYRHGMSGGEHWDLAESLSRFIDARIVVSYYMGSPEEETALGEMYSERNGWATVELKARKTMANSLGKPESVAPEVLFIKNGGGSPPLLRE